MVAPGVALVSTRHLTSKTLVQGAVAAKQCRVGQNPARVRLRFVTRDAKSPAIAVVA
jgi:hypothetical protein